ncbi:MAG: sugar ABC transporter permease, partial [Pseudomonadota bacterium]
LSPVVIANIWQWVLHRRGILNDTIGDASTTITNVAGRAGFDIVVTVIVAVLLLLLSERTLRSKTEPSLLWGSLFAALFILVFSWANPLSPVGANADGYSFWVAALIGAGVIWLIGNDHRFARMAVVALGVLSVILLLTIQFDAVFDFGRYRPINWLVTPNTGWPFFWLVFVFTWSHMGFYMLILLAGLQAIPKDLYEAAKMDAAKPLRVFFRITFPLLMPTFTVVVVLALIRGFQVFDEVYLLTGGGPGRETFMVVQNIYEEAFQGENPNYGEAAAGSVLMAVVIAVFTGIQLFATRRQSGL